MPTLWCRITTVYLVAAFFTTTRGEGSCGDFLSDSKPCDDFTAADAAFAGWGAVDGLSHILHAIDDDSIWPSDARIACELGVDSQVVCASFQGYDATATRLGSEIKADIQTVRSLECATCGWTHFGGRGGYFVVDLYSQDASLDCDGVCWQNTIATAPSRSASTLITTSRSSQATATESSQPIDDPGSGAIISHGLTLESIIKIVSGAVGIPAMVVSIITIWKCCFKKTR